MEEGVALGTPQFFAPGQVRYAALDERIDLYAMGVVLYSLVTSRGPFEHLTHLHEVLEAHMWTPPERPSRIAPQPISPEVDDAILKALAKRPEDRFPRAHAFAEALTHALRAKPRWVSTEPLDRSALATASPFAWRPPPPAEQRWNDTEPLPTLHLGMSRPHSATEPQ